MSRILKESGALCEAKRRAQRKAAELFPLRAALASVGIRPFKKSSVAQYKQAVQEGWEKTKEARWLAVRIKALQLIKAFSIILLYLSAVTLGVGMLVGMVLSFLGIAGTFSICLRALEVLIASFLITMMCLEFEIRARGRWCIWNQSSSRIIGESIPSHVWARIEAIKSACGPEVTPHFYVETFGSDPLIFVYNGEIGYPDRAWEHYCFDAWNEPEFLGKRKN